MGFVFYDTETTGTDAAFDQILQFAAIHTDPELNEIERFEVRCRLLPHIVPAPGAMRVTKVAAARLLDLALPSHYEMMCRIRDKLMSWSPALFIGYNSIEFDEHLLRQALYKNLHAPYLTNTNGNSRSDALRMVQAASLFAPAALQFPVGDDGGIVFKLDQVAPLNGFPHERAHDACADVEATIFLCRLLMTRAPELWSTFMRFSQKAAVTDHILGESVFCLSDFYFGNPYSWIVTVLGANAENGSEFYAYNLDIDPQDLATLPDDELSDRIVLLPKPIRRLRCNACPIIVPVEDAPAIAAAARLGTEELARRAEFLRGNESLRARLIATFEASRKERPLSPHIELQLYDGFFPKEDEVLVTQFHEVPWEERSTIIGAFKDARLRKIGQRLIYLERPDLLGEVKRLKFEQAIASRIGNDDIDTPWLTLPRALAHIEDLLIDAEAAEAALLAEHREHLLKRTEAVALLLKAPTRQRS
jgi:exodeoxyribonuclease-1